MRTVKERLQFLVSFSQLDLVKLRPGDWMNLRDDLYTFLCAPPGEGFDWGLNTSPDPIVVLDVKEFGEDKFKAIQKEMESILSDFGKTRGKEFSFSPKIPITANYFLSSENSWNTVVVEGPIRDVILLALFFLLQHHGSNPILRCPECEKIFYRIRKQKYCSRLCSNRVSVRRFRETEEGKKYERARSKKRYKEKINEALGINVVINKAKKSKATKRREK